MSVATRRSYLPEPDLSLRAIVTLERSTDRGVVVQVQVLVLVLVLFL